MTSREQLDIEMGERRAQPFLSTMSGSQLRSPRGYFTRLRDLVLAHVQTKAPNPAKEPKPNIIQIEDYPAGYPRFSALIAADEAFHICRRFSNLRVRLLLNKQDKLSRLEKQLENLDLNEAIPLRLGSLRMCPDRQREEVISEIDIALADYDALVRRNHKALSLAPAKYRYTSSLQSWVDGNGCIAREETAYLENIGDLQSVAPSTEDTALTSIKILIEYCLVRIYKWRWKRSNTNISRDRHVHIFSRSYQNAAARILMVPVLLSFLLVPVIICNSLNNLISRVIVVAIASCTFVALFSGLTAAKTLELFVAGSTYTAVLVVFISGANLQLL